MQLSLFVLRLTVIDEVPDFTSPKCNNILVCAVFKYAPHTGGDRALCNDPCM